jgi:hypothetical protein
MTIAEIRWKVHKDVTVVGRQLRGGEAWKLLLRAAKAYKFCRPFGSTVPLGGLVHHGRKSDLRPMSFT